MIAGAIAPALCLEDPMNVRIKTRVLYGGSKSILIQKAEMIFSVGDCLEVSQELIYYGVPVVRHRPLWILGRPLIRRSYHTPKPCHIIMNRRISCLLE